MLKGSKQCVTVKCIHRVYMVTPDRGLSLGDNGIDRSAVGNSEVSYQLTTHTRHRLVEKLGIIVGGGNN